VDDRQRAFDALNQPVETTATSITVGGVLVVDQVLFENGRRTSR
jgi:hypothetical protein